MRCADADACDMRLMMKPSWPMGRNRYARYRLNFCHSPMVSVPLMIWRPPKYNTAACPRLAIRKITREQERKHAPHFELLLEHRVRGVVEALLLVRLAAEGAHHPQTGHVFLQHGVQRAESNLDAHEQRLSDRPNQKNTTKAMGRMGSTTSVRVWLLNHMHDQRGDQQQERLHRHHQALADEQAHFFDVVGGADHQLAGLVAIQVRKDRRWILANS